MPALPPILIVDDDPDDIFILRRLLLKAGVQNKTVAFEDPKLAVLHLKAVVDAADPFVVPNVAFSDLNMPHMSGIQFAQWARAEPGLSRMRIVMTSSSEDPRDKSAALEAGVEQYLVKYPPVRVIESLVINPIPG
jgi:CheY-like chemotaxis protein